MSTKRIYSQGICEDGAAILCDGKPITIEQILYRLRALEDLFCVIDGFPSPYMSRYPEEDAAEIYEGIHNACSLVDKVRNQDD